MSECPACHGHTEFRHSIDCPEYAASLPKPQVSGPDELLVEIDDWIAGRGPGMTIDLMRRCRTRIADNAALAAPEDVPTSIDAAIRFIDAAVEREYPKHWQEALEIKRGLNVIHAAIKNWRVRIAELEAQNDRVLWEAAKDRTEKLQLVLANTALAARCEMLQAQLDAYIESGAGPE